jgi:ElaB/YqjD/DUF883 family membrane-anchored ribosome-binding protein
MDQEQDKTSDKTNGKSGAGSGGMSDSQAASMAARDKLLDELKHAIDEAETWLKDAKTQKGAEYRSEIRDRFADTLRTAKTDFLKLEDSVVARTRIAAQNADVYVRDNPWKAVGLGAAVGVIVGMLIGRK